MQRTLFFICTLIICISTNAQTDNISHKQHTANPTPAKANPASRAQSAKLKTGAKASSSAVSTATGTANGHGYVDLGLPSGTLWATCNIGASKPEELGNYYAWGETSTKSFYDKSTYKYYDSENSRYTRYGTSGKNADYILELLQNDDAAYINWGEGWFTPTAEDCMELVMNCDEKQATIGGKKGYIFVGPNKKSIFIPMAGFFRNNSATPGWGFYLTRELRDQDGMMGPVKLLELQDRGWTDDVSLSFGNRYDGYSVRPVRYK